MKSLFALLIAVAVSGCTYSRPDQIMDAENFAGKETVQMSIADIEKAIQRYNQACKPIPAPIRDSDSPNKARAIGSITYRGEYMIHSVFDFEENGNATTIVAHTLNTSIRKRGAKDYLGIVKDPSTCR